MTTFRDVIAGARYRADQSVNGPGPHAGDRTTDSEWRDLVNDAIRYAYKIASAARPDFQVSSTGPSPSLYPDITIVSGGSASFAVPADFYDLIDVVVAPDTTSERSLGPYAWQNRRSPGGWPAYLGFPFAGSGGSAARLMGSNIYIEPSLQAGGIYRVWYCPKPKLIRADTTVKYATAAGLPPTTSTGSGPGYFLTANANGALVIDGVTPLVGDIILVKDQTIDLSDNGIYTVTTVGSAGAPFVITRSTSFDQATELPLGLMTYVSAGATNIDVFFELSNTVVQVDVTAQLWVEAFVDPILADHALELLKIKAAIPAIDRDDDLSLTRLGADLATEGAALSAYLKNTRTANGPQKMIDTDSMGPRGWGSGW